MYGGILTPSSLTNQAISLMEIRFDAQTKCHAVTKPKRRANDQGYSLRKQRDL
jgi:hypothetical protein